MESNESNAANLHTSVTINTPSKVIYCSDGVIEDIMEDNVEEVAGTPQNQVSEVDPVSEFDRNSTVKRSCLFLCPLHITSGLLKSFYRLILPILTHERLLIPLAKVAQVL